MVRPHYTTSRFFSENTNVIFKFRFRWRRRRLRRLLHRIVSLATLRVQSDLCLNESIFTLVDKLRKSTNLSGFFY